MRRLGNLLILIGTVLLIIFGYQIFEHFTLQKQSLTEAKDILSKQYGEDPYSFTAEYGEIIGTMEIPKLGRTLPIVEGTDPDALKKGVGHLSESVFPGQGEQIVLSGHRDTAFRKFGEIEIGDLFIINMPYGKYTYEIKGTEIVPADDTSVIRKMGEEVLVVTTCYPFRYIGNAPDRFIAYAYPVKK